MPVAVVADAFDALAVEERGNVALADRVGLARRWLWRTARVAAEAGGATAVAALLSEAYVPQDGERVCVIVCGGNADPSDLS